LNSWGWLYYYSSLYKQKPSEIGTEPPILSETYLLQPENTKLSKTTPQNLKEGNLGVMLGFIDKVLNKDVLANQFMVSEGSTLFADVELDDGQNLMNIHRVKQILDRYNFHFATVVLSN
jgi:hypothetical protein